MEAAQVRTKKRVSDHGEVLTGQREVNAMLDLVKQETERIDSRFLEPACGDGNFLTAILERKLAVVEKRYGRSQLDFERYAVLAVSSTTALIFCLTMSAIVDEGSSKYLTHTTRPYSRLPEEVGAARQYGTSLNGISFGAMP